MSKEGSGEARNTKPPSTFKYGTITLEFLTGEIDTSGKKEEEEAPTLRRSDALAEEIDASGRKEEEAPRKRGPLTKEISRIVVQERVEESPSDKLLSPEHEENSVNSGSLTFFVGAPPVPERNDAPPSYRRAPSRTFYSADSVSCQTPRFPTGAGRPRAYSDGAPPRSRG